MKYYHVTIQVNDTAPLPAEDNCAMLRMELLFTIGDDAKHVPVGARPGHPEKVTAAEIIKGTLVDLHLLPNMRIMEVEEITREDAEHYAYNT